MSPEYRITFTAKLPSDAMAREKAALVEHYAGADNVEIFRLEEAPRVVATKPVAFLERPAAVEDYVHQGLARAIRQSFGEQLSDHSLFTDIGGAAVQHGKKSNSWMNLPVWSPILKRATQREKVFISKSFGRTAIPPYSSGRIDYIREYSPERLAKEFGISLHAARFIREAISRSR